MTQDDEVCEADICSSQEKASDFAGGVGGPEDKRASKERNHGGDDEVRTNIRGPAGDQVRDYAKNP